MRGQQFLVRSVLHQPLIVHLLRLVLCVAVYSIELATFWPYIRRCRNRLSKEANTAPIQLLILTDPQIITGNPHPSYPGFLPKVFFPLARTFADRYLSRAWRALRSPGSGVKDWTATVWMGDLTDTGRDHYLQEGLPELYDRFYRLFPESKTNAWNTTFYLPGNHDIYPQAPSTWHDPPFNAYWLLQTREYTRVKFLHLFGTSVVNLTWDAPPISPPTSLSHTIVKPELDGLSRYTTRRYTTMRKAFSARVPIRVAHADGSPPTTVAEMILLDAVDIVSLQRMGRSPWNQPPDGKPGSEADWRVGGSWWFVDEMGKNRDPSIPRILFTHIPLYRDPTADVSASCQLPPIATFPAGVMPAGEGSGSGSGASPLTRQSSRPIQMGTDAKGSYENMIDAEWSKFIMDRIQPSVIFSGDDHDYCHHLHDAHTGGSASIPELTVNALSLTSGVRTAGYARLSIWQEPPRDANGLAVGSLRPQTRISYTGCALPPQIEFWAQMYPLVVVLTGVILLARRSLLMKSTKSRRGGGGAGTSAALSSLLPKSLSIPRWARDEHPDLEGLRSGSSSGESHQLHVLGGDDDDSDADADADEATKLGNTRSRRSNSHTRSRSRSRSPSRTGLKASPALNSRLPLPQVGSRSGSGSTSSASASGASGSHGDAAGPTTLMRLFAADFVTVAWVPIVYWLTLWLLGF